MEPKYFAFRFGDWIPRDCSLRGVSFRLPFRRHAKDLGENSLEDPSSSVRLLFACPVGVVDSF